MSREARAYDSTSSPRRRTPPQDIRRGPPSGPAAGIHIRGLARERDEQRAARDDHRPLDDRRGPAAARDQDYRHDRRPHNPPDYDRRRRYSPSPSHSRSRSPTPRRRYRDRDMPDFRSPDRNQLSRSTSPRRRDRSPSYAGPPSKEVMLDGLPVEMTEDDIISELKAYRVDSLEVIRVIRDRKTGTSRQFGFIRFPSVDESRAFVERNFPTIYLYGSGRSDQNSQATPVRIAFSRERNDRDRPGAEADWVCRNCSTVNFSRRTECLRCKVSKADAEVKEDENLGNPSQFTNTGDSDVSDSAPSQFLLFRSLESSVTEDLLAKGAAKLLKSGDENSSTENAPPKPTSAKVVSTSTVAHAGARPGCIRRVLLVRDKMTNESWRYGFVEFAAVEDAQAALAKFNSLDRFTIASGSVLVSYIHAGVFKPVLKPGELSYTFGASTNPELKLAYWDDEAYVNVLVVSTPAENLKSTGDSVEGSGTSSSLKEAGKSTKDAEGKNKKRKADGGAAASGSSTKKMASHLQFWTNRHNELHGVEPTADSTSQQDRRSPERSLKPAATASTSTPSAETPASTSSAPTHQQSYADPEKYCCYLCSRQFKSAAEVNKHERLSELHKTNLQNAELVSKAEARLEKAGIPLIADSSSDPSQSAYRDRAKERRQAYNQPKQPGSSASAAVATTNQAPTTPADNPPNAAEQPPDPAQSSPQKPKSKGAALLASMGYTPDSGRGLGAHGTGITAPIAADLYAAGVGLGAEGGKVGDAVEEAGRATRGDYKEFAQRTRDRARERFGKLE